ncbi:hypothetical protein A2U01_0115843, partial [Trifolium medium]|nr:hypothetical protein [Trifolium medium]
FELAESKKTAAKATAVEKEAAVDATAEVRSS